MRVLVAMSGGVDSSAAAALLAAAGHEVIGVSMRVADFSDAARGRSCCAPDDLEDARAAARRLGIPFFVANVEARFRARASSQSNFTSVLHATHGFGVRPER